MYHMRSQLWGPHEDSRCGNKWHVSSVEPHAMAVLGPKCDAICRDHIWLSVLGTTCDCNYGVYTPLQFWELNVMPFVWTKYGCQSLGSHAMAIMGSVCHGSSGENLRWHYLDPHAMAIVGTTYGWQFWGSRAISFLGTTRDVIAGEHIRWKFLGQYGISVLCTT
jgi:hypothetical protein